jgi:hypothetical protein
MLQEVKPKIFTSEVFELKTELIALYHDFCRTALEKVIKMGELLCKIKKEVGHSNFNPWIKDNLPFSQVTAERYMGVYLLSKRKDIPKDKELTQVYKLLPHRPKPPTVVDILEDTQDTEPKPVEQAEQDKDLEKAVLDGVKEIDNCKYIWISDDTLLHLVYKTQRLSIEQNKVVTVTDYVNTLIKQDPTFTPKQEKSLLKLVKGR